MAFLKKLLKELNLKVYCQKYGLSLWQCPQFLFLVMGLIIGLSAIAIYLIGTRYIENPATVALIILIISALLFLIGFFIVRGFEGLAEANRMKSEFINIVSHQLRSPLANLRWTLELLMSGKFGKIEEEQVEYFRILKENLARMKDLISDLLTVSRIETASLPSQKEKFSLVELTEKIIKEFLPYAQASNVKIEFNSSSSLPFVLADPFQIRKVIENLLDNAIRYMKPSQDQSLFTPRGVVKIKIFPKRKKLIFEIKDNGWGIPKNDQKYVFQKFFRGSNLKRKTQGTGLGLYISKAIIEKSGGKIWFESKEGQGSTFWFSLPIK